MSKKKIILNPATDCTMTVLVVRLNKKYKTKKTGEPFNLQDVQNYIRRGYLPSKYGGQFIEQIIHPKIGIRILRLNKKKK